MCQPYHYTYRILFLNYLETRLTIKPIDEIDEACKSNVGQELNSVYSISMVITQPKLIANSRAVKCQRVEESV